jgi:hypothetical protein
MTPITLSLVDGKYFNGILSKVIDVFYASCFTVVTPAYLLNT